MISKDSSKQNVSKIKKITWIGMIINIVLSILKFIGGILGSSQAVVADAVHSFSDITTDLAVLFGVKYWSAPADKNHPYGHGRIETIITAAIGLILLIVGVNIGYKSLINIRETHVEQPGMIAFVFAFVSIVVKEILYRWSYKEGKKIGSSAIVANAWHHRTDALSSIPVSITVMIAIFSKKWSFLDHIGATVVSIFIVYSSFRILKSSLMELSDSGAEEHVYDAIEAIALQNDCVKEVHAIRARQMGSGILVDMHVLVDGSISVCQGHDVCEAVKKSIIDSGHNILDVVVHLEPFEN